MSQNGELGELYDYKAFLQVLDEKAIIYLLKYVIKRRQKNNYSIKAAKEITSDIMELDIAKDSSTIKTLVETILEGCKEDK